MTLMSWGEFHFVCRRLSKCAINSHSSPLHCWPSSPWGAGERVWLDYDKLVCAGVSDSSQKVTCVSKSCLIPLFKKGNKNRSLMRELWHKEILQIMNINHKYAWVLVFVHNILIVLLYNIVHVPQELYFWDNIEKELSCFFSFTAYCNTIHYAAAWQTTYQREKEPSMIIHCCGFC